MAWLTNKETGGHFNTDWIDEKEKQISNNQRQADKLNGKTTDYSKFKDVDEMTEELYKRTGIRMGGDLEKLSKSTAAQVCTTLEDLQNKYNVNPVIGENPEHKLGLKVVVPYEFEKSFDTDAYAQADCGKVELNSKYYSLEQEEINEIYEAEHKGFHPEGTTGKDIIAHEVAHCMLNNYVWEHCKHDIDKFFECQTWLITGKYHNPDNPNKTVYDLNDKFNRILEKMKNNPEFKEEWGGGPSLGLLGIVNPQYSIPKFSISEYAGKNRHELVAEAFADFYGNGSKAKTFSKIVIKEIFALE